MSHNDQAFESSSELEPHVRHEIDALLCGNSQDSTTQKESFSRSMQAYGKKLQDAGVLPHVDFGLET